MAFEHASALSQLGDYVSARDTYTRILESAAGEDRARAFALRGYCCWKERRYADARRDFDAAISLKPLFLRGRCRGELNDVDGALSDYRAVLRLDSNAHDAWQEIGYIYKWRGASAEAEHAFEMAKRAR